jgi:multidrug efflux system outer membrane protein
MAIVALGALALTGCKMGPNYHRPEVPVPAQWLGSASTNESIASVPWWNFFGDPTLNDLIGTALRNSFDVRVAVARIEQAQGSYHVQRAALFPSVDASAGWTRSHSDNPITGTAQTTDQFNLLGLLSYEVDFWGRVRRLNEAARANLLAAQESRRTVYITLISQVASTYFQLRALDEQVQISRRTVQSREKSLDLTRVRFNNGQGIASELDIRQAETLLYTAQATLADEERQVVLTEDELNSLLGRNPVRIPRERPMTEPQVSQEIPAGLPSDLLLRRPDIRAAEQQLIAANANIGAARAAYFPTISLTAALGLESIELRDLFDAGASHTWSFAPRLLQPIFNGGRIRGGVEVARGARDEALAEYQRSIQNAFREVEDALVSVQKISEQRTAQEKTVGAERSRLELSNLRYESGVASYSDVLDAERSLFAAELTLAQLRSSRLSAIAQVYRALGPVE